jgi:hypothetical protein
VESQKSNLNAYLLEQYGPTMTLGQFGLVVKKATASMYNDMRRGTFPVPTYKVGGRHLVSTHDVIAFLDGRKLAQECNDV